VLPTLPMAILLAVYAGYRAVVKLKLPDYAVGGMVVLAIFTFSSFTPLIEPKSYTYTGFKEMGAQVEELEGYYHFNTIYSQSIRQIRAFSGVEFYADGGKIKMLPSDLNELLNQTGILIQLDIWEYTGPEWAYPLTQEKVDNLIANNFTMVHVVYRDYPTQDGLQKIPVGLLMVK